MSRTVAGKICRRRKNIWTIRLFIYFVKVTHEKNREEEQGCHRHSNHELQVNATIFIQMREKFETMNK
jgi:hypothetical protein